MYSHSGPFRSFSLFSQDLDLDIALAIVLRVVEIARHQVRSGQVRSGQVKSRFDLI